MSPASCGNLVTPRDLSLDTGSVWSMFYNIPAWRHTHRHTHTHTKGFTTSSSQIAILYKVSCSKGCRVHELQCNMCGHSNTSVFASTANLWFAINHSIRLTLPPNAAKWRRVPSDCKRSGHVSVTHIPLHKELQHTLHTHLPHISRGVSVLLHTTDIDMRYMYSTLKHTHAVSIYTVYNNKQTHLVFAVHITLVLVDEVLGKFKVSILSCTE